MLALIRLDAVTLADGQQMRLMRRGSEFSIMLGTNTLMNSRLSGSEAALADLACQRLAGRPAPRILIGGLGMGFTLRAALAALGQDAEITVAELVPAVIDWARGPMADLFAGCLDRPPREPSSRRCRRRHPHGGGRLRRHPARCRQRPRRPHAQGQRRALFGRGPRRRQAGTRLPAASSRSGRPPPTPPSRQRLKQAGFGATEIPTRASGKRGERHMIWVAVKG